jgi:hypothetical protein
MAFYILYGHNTYMRDRITRSLAVFIVGAFIGSSRWIANVDILMGCGFDAFLRIVIANRLAIGIISAGIRICRAIIDILMGRRFDAFLRIVIANRLAVRIIGACIRICRAIIGIFGGLRLNAVTA